MSTPTITSESVLTKQQRAKFGPRHFDYCGERATITAEVRYDDDCNNGHNTFSITADIRAVDRRMYRRDNGFIAGGCCHEEVAQVFPELAPLIKWHLCSSDGPMHYIANTLHFASTKDCWGHEKGEPYGPETSIQFGDNPIKHQPGGTWGRRGFMKFLQDYRAGVGGSFDFEVIRYDPHTEEDRKLFGPKFTFGGYAEKWHECPFDTEQEALDFLYALQHCEPKFVTIMTQFGKGKEAELDSARHAAIWPDATNEELTAPGLKERLEARLPALLAEFRAAVESLGFTW